jgi:hypothetical protein
MAIEILPQRQQSQRQHIWVYINYGLYDDCTSVAKLIFDASYSFW